MRAGGDRSGRSWVPRRGSVTSICGIPKSSPRSPGRVRRSPPLRISCRGLLASVGARRRVRGHRGRAGLARAAGPLPHSARPDRCVRSAAPSARSTSSRRSRRFSRMPPAPRSRHRSPSPARRSRAGAGVGLFPHDQVAAHAPRHHRHGQDGRARAQLRERRRRDLRRGGRRRAARGDRREPRRRHRDPARGADDARIAGAEIEPALWEVDANLRPEGKQGALVRTLDSHLSYYDRWAKSWEFQALLKARPIAGDVELGAAYVGAVQPKVWTSAARENFVDNVQRMRERVTEHIPAAELAHQIKLGPRRHPRHRVHRAAPAARPRTQRRSHPAARHARSPRRARGRGVHRPRRGGDVRARLPRAACAGAPDAAASAASDAPHAVPPGGAAGARARVAARRHGSTGCGSVWESVKREVRDIHVRLFYRPLLSAVAALPAEDASSRRSRRMIGSRRSASPIQPARCATSRLSPAA